MIGAIFRYFQSHTSKAVLIASIWTAFILLACFIPGSALPEVNIPLADKWVHFIIFAGFAYLWYFTFSRVTVVNGVLLVLLSAGVGYLVECIQGSGWVVNRSYEINDVLADTIGGMLGVICFHISNRIFKQRSIS